MTADDGSAEIQFRRVGPNGTMPADSQFGVALTSLWHAVSEAGGSVGFVPPVARHEVAPLAASSVDAMRRGRAVGVALLSGSTLIGFGLLTPGELLQRHTAAVTVVMVDPTRQGSGLGRRLMHEILVAAGDLGAQRLTLSVRGGTGVEAFYTGLGFVEWGRNPGWIRVADGDDRDEIHFWTAVAPPSPTA